MFRKILAFKLKLLAQAVLQKYRPKIVAVTGSVGKSTTKEAIAEVLRAKFSLRKSYGNLNTEIGVPVSIITGHKPGSLYLTRDIRYLSRWVGIFGRGLGLIIFKRDYPELLVLEMAADRPGDLEYLTSFVKPDVAVVTNVGISHLQNYPDPEAIKKEKGAVVRALRPGGTAVLNYDDPGAISLREQTREKIITFGLSPEADVRPDAASSDPLPLVYARLAATAVGSVFGIPPQEAAASLGELKNLPGRLRVLPGINDSVIIDDSYNSAPASAAAALTYLKNYSGGRKIAVLGKMAELGARSEAGHRQVGRQAAELQLDLLLVKNNEAKIIADEAVRQGFRADKILTFSSSDEAAERLRELLRSRDVVLFKASQSEYFEDIIKQVLANPEEADLLVQRDYTRPR